MDTSRMISRKPSYPKMKPGKGDLMPEEKKALHIWDPTLILVYKDKSAWLPNKRGQQQVRLLTLINGVYHEFDSREQLAKHLGVTSTTLNRWNNDGQDPSGQVKIKFVEKGEIYASKEN